MDQLLQRANENWQQGELPLARADYERAIALSPGAHFQRGFLATLCPALDDEAEYARHCAFLIAHFDNPQQPHERLNTLRVVYLVPGTADVLSEAKQQQMFDAERGSEWKQRVAILWHYRHGRWQQAIDMADSYLAKHAMWRERAQCMVLRAMALHQTGQLAEAANALADAQRYVAGQSATATKWSEAANLVYLQIFYREATELLRGKRDDLKFTASSIGGTDRTSQLLPPCEALDAALAVNAYEQLCLKRGRWYAARHLWCEACADYLVDAFSCKGNFARPPQLFAGCTEDGIFANDTKNHDCQSFYRELGRFTV